MGEGAPLVLSAMIEVNSGLSHQGRLGILPVEFEHSAASARPAASPMGQTHAPRPLEKGHAHGYPSQKIATSLLNVDMGRLLEFPFIEWNVDGFTTKGSHNQGQMTTYYSFKTTTYRNSKTKDKQGSKHRTCLEESVISPHHCVGFLFFPVSSFRLQATWAKYIAARDVSSICLGGSKLSLAPLLWFVTTLGWFTFSGSQLWTHKKDS